MFFRSFITIFIVLLFSDCVWGQEDTLQKSFSVMAYNVENLFDCNDDSLTWDEEFTPTGAKHWTPYKMYRKINDISKVILAANGWSPPDIIGLCEIENRFVLQQLIYQTGLNNLDYRYVHFDSPDARGVDVAMLYRKSRVDIVDARSVCVSDSALNLLTRDVLYVKGTVLNIDTIHFFVCHWPSKRGGTLQSENKRLHVASVIYSVIDSIVTSNIMAKIVVMGDFNSEMDSEAFKRLADKGNSHSVLSSLIQKESLFVRKIGGSHKYQGQWSLIDHILISKSLINEVGKDNLMFKIVALPFLLEDDLSYSGLKPKRTYVGPRYLGGISDHLPVILRITFPARGERLP